MEKNDSEDQRCWDQEGNFTDFRDHKVEQVKFSSLLKSVVKIYILQLVSGNIAGVSLTIAIYLFCALSVYSFRFGEFRLEARDFSPSFPCQVIFKATESPFKPKLRRVSFALLLLVSFLDIILCSFIVWSNFQENMSHIKCRVTEKISQACFNLFTKKIKLTINS